MSTLEPTVVARFTTPVANRFEDIARLQNIKTITDVEGSQTADIELSGYALKTPIICTSSLTGIVFRYNIAIMKEGINYNAVTHNDE